MCPGELQYALSAIQCLPGGEACEDLGSPTALPHPSSSQRTEGTPVLTDSQREAP